MNKSKIALYFLCGMVSGIFFAQGLFALASRSGGNFGGELFILPLICLLVYMGIGIGRQFPDKREQKAYFQHGYQAGRLSVITEQDVQRISVEIGCKDNFSPALEKARNNMGL